MPGPPEDIHSWSTTASDNANVDAGTPWPEHMARGNVNDSARGLMAALAKNRDLYSGAKTTAGLANAQTVLSGVSYTTIPTGLRMLLKIGADLTNTGPTTLNVDFIGAVEVKNTIGNPLAGGELKAGSFVEFIYDGTTWIALTSTLSLTVLQDITIIEGDTSPSASVEFTDLSDDYSQYVFSIANLRPTTNGAQLWLQVSDDNGATWVTTTTYGLLYLLGTGTIGSTAANFVYEVLPGVRLTTSINSTVEGPFFIGGTTVSAFRTGAGDPGLFLFNNVQLHNVNGLVWYQGASYVYHGYNAIRFSMAPGTIATGNFSMYGVR